MTRFRSVLAVVMVVLSLGLHVEGPHGHHCILEEAACAACRTAVTPNTDAPAVTLGAAVAEVCPFDFVPATAPGLVRLPVLVDAPLRAPPLPAGNA